MSYCKTYGKDKVMFVTKEDHAEKSKIVLPESERQPGLLLPSGEINWNCPCLGGMATGPCGVEFREAFSCFHYSEAEPKGSDCYDTFKSMQDCMSQYPTVYNQNTGDDDDKEGGGLGIDLNLDELDEPDKKPQNSEYADGDEEAKQNEVKVVSK